MLLSRVLFSSSLLLGVFRARRSEACVTRLWSNGTALTAYPVPGPVMLGSDVDTEMVLWTVIDEAALRRPVGGRAVMPGQIDRLIDVAGLPHVTLQVLPLPPARTAVAPWKPGDSPAPGWPSNILSRSQCATRTCTVRISGWC